LHLAQQQGGRRAADEGPRRGPDPEDRARERDPDAAARLDGIALGSDQLFGGITRTVPWARHTCRPSLSTSMRTTAVRFVRETICAAADNEPAVTGAR